MIYFLAMYGIYAILMLFLTLGFIGTDYELFTDNPLSIRKEKGLNWFWCICIYILYIIANPFYHILFWICILIFYLRNLKEE